MMTSAQIRQSFLDFFQSKQHTIVPSSSLMPDQPDIAFTNAGMNQFVPIFLGQTKCPYTPGRAADTQKCIRAGGKHNDLDDVGLDTYHHTFFEMLGNWSFGDYFKKEAIEWAWELVVGVWKFPPQRLYATVYNPDKSKNDPSDFDQEAWNFWAGKFRSVGLDPAVHIVNGNKKDNFWMMGDTGPCGPCSELHVDLTPAGDTRGALVNQGDARCIEIWNLVFIQFNAVVLRTEMKEIFPGIFKEVPAETRFDPLPARHVDTGMGFERVTSIIQGTKDFTDFAHARISNYETDIFRPVFDALERLSGKKYGSTLPTGQSAIGNPQSAIDVAFRVIADHIRTLSFAIADGIQPGNTDRNYVLRRILRRAVRYGRTLGFHEPFFYKLVDVLADTMGDVFPEIRAKKKHVQEVVRVEEEAFNKTLDKGISLFNKAIEFAERSRPETDKGHLSTEETREQGIQGGIPVFNKVPFLGQNRQRAISGELAFLLYDTYGFPLDLTELMARERGLSVDTAGFDKLMEEQKARARAAQKKEVISLSQVETTTPTQFVGFDKLETPAKVLEIVSLKDKTAVILDTSACYAEMGGQVGDTGELTGSGNLWRITNTQKSGNTWLHFLGDAGTADALVNRKSQIVNAPDSPAVGSTVTLTVDKNRRNAIERHHTVTHLLHWALHEVVSKEASQKGSFVGPDKLTFDFNSAPLTPAQVADIERLVNERIVENAGVSWTEVPYADVRSRKDVMQFFGDKYGDTVRVVQIGGAAGALDGYSMELCGGTHTRATGEIGLFRIVGENAIAAGVRRIEAVAGLTAFDAMKLDRELIRAVAGKVNSPVHELEKKIESLLAHQKELERQLKSASQREATAKAKELWNPSMQPEVVNGISIIVHNFGATSGDYLQAVLEALKSHGYKGIAVLGGYSDGAVSLVASVSSDFTAKVQAGKIIQAIAPIVGGKGGGRPDNARGGGKDAGKLDEALAKAKTLLA
jgi:alanyl-tRNA synthetase